MKRIFNIALIFSVVFVIYSCKKDPIIDRETIPRETETDINDSNEDLLKDSVYYYTYLYSLWSPSLTAPTVVNGAFDLRKFSTNYRTAEDVLNFLIGQTPVNNGRPIDRFSFLDRDGTVSSELQAGNTLGMGIHVSYIGQDLYVSMVDVGSPADRASLKRGFQITSINGNANLSYTTQAAQNFDYIFDAFAGANLALVVKDRGGIQSSKQLTRSIYQTEPVLSDTVFRLTKNSGPELAVGYLAFNSFVDVGTAQNPNYMRQQFDAIFDKFQSNNIQELIVDLRYNGGGIVNTAAFLANKIVPKSADKQLMFTYKTNNFLSSSAAFKASFATEYFVKTNALNLPRVYFLVTNSTASSSELLINSLSPYMDVQLVGTNNGRTYGKPVGFFGQSLVDKKAEIFVTSFQLTNSQGNSDYFNGLVANKTNAREDFFKDFGDPEEGMIKQALSHIQTGSYYSASSANAASRGASSGDQSIKLIQHKRLNRDMFILKKK